LHLVQVVCAELFVLLRGRIERTPDGDRDTRDSSRQLRIQVLSVGQIGAGERGQGRPEDRAQRVLRRDAEGIIRLAAGTVPVVVLLAVPDRAERERMLAALPTQVV